MNRHHEDAMRALAEAALERARGSVEQGVTGSLLDALNLMFLYDLAMPAWLRAALGEAIGRYTRHAAATLDDAFGVERPSGYRQPAAERCAQLGPRVARDVQDMILAGAVVDDGLFEAVGDLHGVGKSTVKKWYYASVVYAIEGQCVIGNWRAVPSHLACLRDQVSWKP